MKIKLLLLYMVTPFLIQAHTPSHSEAALKFISALNTAQRQRILLLFDDPLKTSWHYFPASMWPREGIRLNELNESQKKLFFELLQSFLSESGYMKTRKIIDLETVLAEISGSRDFRDPGKYSVAFYGDPAEDPIWGWSFEGHHLSLNFTVAEDDITFTPRFMGANPATVTTGPNKGERVLGVEEDLGFKLINELSDNQKSKAIFRDAAYADIVTSNKELVDPLKPVGIKMGELNPSQQAVLMGIIHEYLSAMPSDLASQRMENVKSEEAGEIMFGWAGSQVPGKPHYYRIQGKTFLIEFDNSQNSANHIHSVWRDFDGDFGRDLIREHYQQVDHADLNH